MAYQTRLLLTAFSRWVWASSLFLVCRYSTEPSCRWVRASTLAGGLNWNTASKQWTHRRIFGGLEVRKCSAKPSKARYQGSGASVVAAISSHPKTKQNTLNQHRTGVHQNWLYILVFSIPVFFIFFFLRFNSSLQPRCGLLPSSGGSCLRTVNLFHW